LALLRGEVTSIKDGLTTFKGDIVRKAELISVRNELASLRAEITSAKDILAKTNAVASFFENIVESFTWAAVFFCVSYLLPRFLLYFIYGI
jgi:hypothetical protein